MTSLNSDVSISKRLADLGIVLPPAPKPVASYVPWVRSGNLVFVSGQIPLVEGKVAWTGRTPSAQSLEQAKAAARQCALNALSVLQAAVGGDLEGVVRIVRLGVFVASDNGFVQQPQVANGASDLLVEVFGERGRHARAAVGSNALPLDATTEVELVAEVR